MTFQFDARIVCNPKRIPFLNSREVARQLTVHSRMKVLLYDGSSPQSREGSDSSSRTSLARC